jgi:hypothetical protein
MNYVAYSHCAGGEVLSSTLKKEIVIAIAAIAVKPAKGAAKKFRTAFLGSLKTSGWSSEVPVAEGSDMTITSIKDGVGLCLQTGNMARMYADLMKLQTLYLDNAIKAAAIIVPSNPIAKLLGSNIAEATRLERELNIFKKAYHVPTVVFGLE